MRPKTILTYLAFAFVIVGADSNAGPVCGRQDPQHFTFEFFGRLESARDRGDFENIYRNLLSTSMRSKVPPYLFAQQFSQLRRDLQIEGRTFQQRMTTPPTLDRDYRQSSVPRGATTVFALTSSPRGKLEQRLVLECERGEWKVAGFWYGPAKY